MNARLAALAILALILVLAVIISLALAEPQPMRSGGRWPSWAGCIPSVEAGEAMTIRL